LNALLPPDIAIRAVAAVDVGFDPRRNARRRWYRYTVCNRDTRAVLSRRYVWHVRDALDLDRMRRATGLLIGEHNFAAFGSPQAAPEARTVRTVYHAGIERHGSNVLFDIVANAFLPHQVRRTVGCLVEIGRGRYPIDDFAAAAAAAVPGTIGPMAPSSGLCLMRVTYDEALFGANETPLPDQWPHLDEELNSSLR
jgi:tRNA pseudouridine38-40 synthase